MSPRTEDLEEGIPKSIKPTGMPMRSNATGQPRRRPGPMRGMAGGHGYSTRYIIPWTRRTIRLHREMLGPLISQGHVFDFLDETDQPRGSIPWVHFPASKAVQSLDR